MVKTIKLEPISQETVVQTNANILSALLDNELDILHDCNGRGMCSTCHVFIKSGMESLSPMNRREQRTLEVIATTTANSRLACQARVMGEGIVVELPAGTYVTAISDIESLIGTRADQNILHPITSKVLVEAGKLITRSMISQLKDTRTQVSDYLARTTDT
jgi:ferredoxin